VTTGARRNATVILIALVAAAPACRTSEADGRGQGEGAGKAAVAPGDLSATLAVMDGVVITVKDLQDAINRQSPYVRSRFKSREEKRQFLDNMVRFEVLAAEATRRGLDRDPEVVQTMKSAMITKLLKQELEAGIEPDDVPEAEVKAFFEANRAEYERPEEVRVSAVILKDRRRAEEVARQAKGEQGRSNKGFRELVARHSVDEETALRGGDLRYFHRGSKEVPAEVVEAAFALERTGDVAGPIAAGGRFYVIKQTGRRKAVSKTYEQVARQIRAELFEKKREAAQKQFVEGLRARAKIELHEENLAKVKVESSGGTPASRTRRGGH